MMGNRALNNTAMNLTSGLDAVIGAAGAGIAIEIIIIAGERKLL